MGNSLISRTKSDLTTINTEDEKEEIGICNYFNKNDQHIFLHIVKCVNFLLRELNLLTPLSQSLCVLLLFVWFCSFCIRVIFFHLTIYSILIFTFG